MSSPDLGSLLFQQAPDGVLLIDAHDLTVIDVNETFCRLTGRTRDQAVGQPVKQLLHPDDVRAVPLAASEALRGEVVVHERRLVRGDGSVLWCQTTTRLTAAGYLTFVRDISSLIRDRQELHRRDRLAHLRTELTTALLEESKSLTHVLDRAAAGLAQMMGEVCVIALLDEHRQFLVPAAFHHVDPMGEEVLQDVLSVPAELGAGLAGRVAAEGVPGRVTDQSADRLRASVPERYHAYVDRFAVNSMLIVPLRSSDGVIGTLGVARGPAYSDDEEHVLLDLADLISAAIEDSHQDAALRRASFLLRTVTDSLPAMVSYWNTDLCNEFANEAYSVWTGLEARELHGRHISEALGQASFEEYESYMRKALQGFRQDYQRHLVEPSGRVRNVQVTYVPDTRPDGRVAGFDALVIDVTRWTQALAEFEYLALHDPLTGLHNRRALLDHISMALKHLQRAAGMVAVLFLDLDGFKQVNDRHGHRVGDVVLRAAADRIRATVRQEDTSARLGGDEFVVLCHISDAAEAEDICGRLEAALAEPIEYEPDRFVRCPASVGMTLATNADATFPEALLAAADSAMFERKRGESPAR